MQKSYSFKKKLKSIKLLVFILVYIPSVIFVPTKLINGTQFVALMSLIVGIFTVAHEFSKGLENGKGAVVEEENESGNRRPPIY